MVWQSINIRLSTTLYINSQVISTGWGWWSLNSIITNIFNVDLSILWLILVHCCVCICLLPNIIWLIGYTNWCQGHKNTTHTLLSGPNWDQCTSYEFLVVPTGTTGTCYSLMEQNKKICVGICGIYNERKLSIPMHSWQQRCPHGRSRNLFCSIQTMHSSSFTISSDTTNDFAIVT